MKEINLDKVYPLNRHHNIKNLHDFDPLKSFTLSNASLDLHLSRSLISQLCLDNSALDTKMIYNTSFERPKSKTQLAVSNIMKNCYVVRLKFETGTVYRKGAMAQTQLLSKIQDFFHHFIALPRGL